MLPPGTVPMQSRPASGVPQALVPGLQEKQVANNDTRATELRHWQGILLLLLWQAVHTPARRSVRVRRVRVRGGRPACATRQSLMSQLSRRRRAGRK